MGIIRLDGMRIKVEPPDLDGDGQIGGVEKVTQKLGTLGETEIIQPTELGESLQELNSDDIENNSRMSKIDLRSRLHPMEINSILAMDSLVAFKVLPGECISFTRQKKRLSVSLQGKGREEVVQMTNNKKQSDAETGGQGLLDKMRGKS